MAILLFILLLQWQCLADIFDDGLSFQMARTLPDGDVIVNQKSLLKLIPNYDDISLGSNDDQEAIALGEKPRKPKKATTKSSKNSGLGIIRNVSQSIFPSLDNYHDGASVISESKYPFIARIVHSKTLDYPFICTASCIENQIFITAARCVSLLKIEYTTVIHRKKRLHPIAFLIPSSPTKQMFDDIGIIVVNGADFKHHWAVVKLFEGNRTDNSYQWLAKLQLHKSTDHVAIGYASHKNFAKFNTAQTKFELYELQVHIGITLCTVYGRKIGYYVPCYHACDLTKPSDPKCNKYLGTEGAAVLNLKSNKLLGVATWGGKRIHELPVGFSVPNSESFFEDLACARKIRDTKTVNPAKNYYQKLCERQ